MRALLSTGGREREREGKENRRKRGWECSLWLIQSLAMATQALVSCSCTSVSAKEQLGSAFWGAPTSSNNPIISGSGYDDSQVRCFGRRTRPPLPGVRMAISRKKKEETVDRAKQQLEGAYLVAGIKYAGLTVKQFQQLRKSLPQDTTLMVAKNKLIGNGFPLHCLLRLHWFWTQSIKSHPNP